MFYRYLFQIPATIASRFMALPSPQAGARIMPEGLEGVNMRRDRPPDSRRQAGPSGVRFCFDRKFRPIFLFEPLDKR